MNAIPTAARDGATRAGEAARGDELARLRARIERIERRTRTGSDARVLPVAPGIARLLPDGGLRTGSAYALGRSMPLLQALLAEPSRTGTWCAVVGMPEIGAEAAAAAGIDLARLVLVPRPGDRWLGVVAALAEAMGVIAVRPGGRVRDSQAARLAARLRERETVLLAQGAWPQAEAAIETENVVWSGLADGHGSLERCETTVVVAGRRTAGTRRGRILLAGAEITGAALPVGTPVSSTLSTASTPSAASASRMSDAIVPVADRIRAVG